MTTASVVAGCSGDAPPDAVWEHGMLYNWRAPESVVTDGLLLMHAGGAIIALDAATGDERWDVPNVEGQVRVAGDAVIAVTPDGQIKVYDLATGEARFRKEPRLSHNPPVVTATATTLFTAEIDADDDKKRIVVATDLASGDEVWRRTFSGEVALSAPVLPDSLHGELAYTVLDPAIRFAADSPVLYLNTGLAEEGDEKTLVLDAATGEDREAPNPKAALDLDGSLLVAATDGSVLSQTVDPEFCELTVTAYEPASGTSRAMVFGGSAYVNPDSFCGPDFALLQVAGDVLYGVNSDGKPMLVDIASGQPRWTAPEAGKPGYYSNGIATYEPPADREGVVDVTTGESVAGDESVSGILRVLPKDLVIGTTESPQIAATAYELDGLASVWKLPGGKLIAYTEDRMYFSVGGTTPEEHPAVVITAVSYP